MSQDFIRGKHSGIKGMKKKRRRFNRHKSSSQSLAKLSNSDQNLARGGQGSLVSMRGRSRSQLSLGRAPSMTQLVEEPRRATSTTSKGTSQDIVRISLVYCQDISSILSGYLNQYLIVSVISLGIKFRTKSRLKDVQLTIVQCIQSL